MSLSTEKDLVLDYLLDSPDEVNLMGMHFADQESPPAVFHKLFFKHRHELEQAGFIEYHEGQGNLDDIQRAYIKPAGYVFRLNGGYTAIEEKQLREEQLRLVEWKWRRGYEGGSLLTAVAALVVAVLTLFFTPKNSDIEKLQLQIDSLQTQVNKLRDSTLSKQYNQSP